MKILKFKTHCLDQFNKDDIKSTNVRVCRPMFFGDDQFISMRDACKKKNISETMMRKFLKSGSTRDGIPVGYLKKL